MQHIPHIAFDIDGDFINLQQDDGCGTIHYATLHRTHLECIAGQLGIPVLTGTASELARRLGVLRERIDQLQHNFLNSDILDRSGDAREVYIELDALDTIAAEFVADLRKEPRNDNSAPGNENAAAISVTPSEAVKRGRPPTGEAMSNAERQAKHRQKQAGSGQDASRSAEQLF